MVQQADVLMMHPADKGIASVVIMTQRQHNEVM